MSTARVFFYVILTGCVFLALRCTNPPLAGNSSQTPNAIVGKLYQPDGVTPAAGVSVHIRPKKSLADTSTGLAKSLATLAATDSVVTDSTGRFAFDSTLDTGTYVIEAASGNNTVLIDSVTVKNQDLTDTLPPDTLKPAGALKGVIYLSEGGDPRKVFVLAFGIDRFARVNADGSFKFSNLAEAKYDLRMISSLDNYGVLDTFGISINSADTANLDTIRLPFTGIPTPKNVSIAYDTLRQIVTLTWAKADTALARTYNVYRRNVGLNTVLARINTSPIADTVYRDLTGVQDSTYEYVVAAVSPANMEGTKSAVVSLKVVSAYFLAATIGSKGTNDNQLYMPRNAISKNGTYLILDVVSPYPSEVKAKIFNENGTFVNSFSVRKNSSADLIYGMSSTFDKLNNLIVCFKDSTFQFDSLGNLLNKYRVEFASIEPRSTFIKASDSILIYVMDQAQGEILVKNLNNDTISKFAMPTASVNNLSGLTVDSLGNIYVGDIGAKKVLKYDSNGSLLMELGPNSTNAFTFGRIQSILIDSKGRMIVDDANKSKIFIFDSQGKLLCQFETFINTKIWQGTVNDNSEHLNMFFTADGSICLLEGNSYGSVFVYKPLSSSF